MLHHGRSDRARFDYRAIGGQVAEEDSQAAAFAVRLINRKDHFRVFDFCSGDVFPQRFEGHGWAVEVERAGLF